MEQVFPTLCIFLSFLFAFIIGFHSGLDVIATAVLSRSMPVHKALCAVCIGELIGPFLFGTAVAVTLGTEIVDPALLHPSKGIGSSLFILAALGSALGWNVMTWWIGIPSHSSHALVGSIMGAAVAAFGSGGVKWHPHGSMVLMILLVTPAIGMAISYFLMFLTRFFPSKEKSSPGVFFKWIQAASLGFLAACHGSNCSQRVMAVITMVLWTQGSLETFKVPLWVMASSSVSLAFAVSMGGLKIRSMAQNRVFSIEPVHSFVSQVSAGVTLLAANLMGCPVSSVQIIKSTVMGVGTESQKRSVRWRLTKEIMVSWLITFPASACLAAALYWITSGALGHGMGSFEKIMKVWGQ